MDTVPKKGIQWKLCFKTAVASAVIAYNDGAQGLLPVSNKLGIEIGNFTKECLRKLDIRRVKQSEKKLTSLLKQRRRKTSFNQKRSMPERADKYLTPATRLLEKRREILEMEQALSTQKEEFQLQMESVQQRREQLDRKKHELKESLLKFDKFLKENDSKRTRAIKKMTDEREAKRGKEREIEKLEEEMRQLIKARDKIQKKGEKYSICQQYLDKTIEISDDFQELREITARYDTLINTHNELIVRENKHQDDIENEKSKLSKFVEKKNNEMLNYNNQLAQLQTELEKEQSNALKWESEWTHIQNTAAKKTLLLGKIKMATHNLFQLINKNAKEAETVESTVEQLNKIQTFIQDLSQITNEIKRSENLNL